MSDVKRYEGKPVFLNHTESGRVVRFVHEPGVGWTMRMFAAIGFAAMHGRYGLNYQRAFRAMSYLQSRHER